MSDRDDTDASFADVFKTKFATGVNTGARLKAERRAGRTPKERHRGGGKGPLRNVQINVRGTAQTKKLLEHLAEFMKGSHADVIEAAIEHFAKANKVGG